MTNTHPFAASIWPKWVASDDKVCSHTIHSRGNGAVWDGSPRLGAAALGWEQLTPLMQYGTTVHSGTAIIPAQTGTGNNLVARIDSGPLLLKMQSSAV